VHPAGRRTTCAISRGTSSQTRASEDARLGEYLEILRNPAGFRDVLGDEARRDLFVRFRGLGVAEV
jgi:hypothetical protein